MQRPEITGGFTPESVAKLRLKLGRQEACNAFGSSAADQLANLLVKVRERLAAEGGLSDQLVLCQVAEQLQWVRDVVQLAGKTLQQHELVFGVVTMSNHGGLAKEVELLNWAIAVLMGRTIEPAPI
jgi:hypothetical protein